MLHRGRARFCADLCEQRIPGDPIRVGRPDLDQLVCAKAALDFRHDRVGETCRADQDYRLERVCAGAQGAPPGRRQ